LDNANFRVTEIWGDKPLVLTENKFFWNSSYWDAVVA